MDDTDGNEEINDKCDWDEFTSSHCIRCNIDDNRSLVIVNLSSRDFMHNDAECHLCDTLTADCIGEIDNRCI